MALNIIKTPSQMKRSKIFNTLINLIQLPKVSIKRIDEYNVFEIQHEQQFVPDWRFEWCSVKEHYRVYICLADRNHDKRKVGYPVCTIGSGLSAIPFGATYAFFHKHRANNKEEAYSNAA